MWDSTLFFFFCTTDRTQGLAYMISPDLNVEFKECIIIVWGEEFKKSLGVRIHDLVWAANIFLVEPSLLWDICCCCFLFAFFFFF